MRRMPVALAFVLAAAMLAPTVAMGQEVPPRATTSPARAAEAGTTEPSPEATSTKPNGSRVLIASAAYPGLGQFLNGTERKAAIIGGAEALLIAQLLLEDRWTRYALKNYRETGDNDYFEEYSEHFDRRQTLIWWTAILALYSITDAYVDAHLSGFDDNTPGGLDAAVAAAPAFGGDGFRVGFEVRF